MSKYSGKSDLYDDIMYKFNDFSKVHIFINNNMAELRIDSEKDLVPYYPFVPFVETYNPKTGELRAYIGDKPYYIKEELCMLETYLRYVKTAYNKLKRNKIKPTVDLVYNEIKKNCIWLIEDDIDTVKTLIQRVIDAKGKQIKFDDLQLNYSQYYRNLLYEEMIRVGYIPFKAKEWCYGWDRAYKQSHINKKRRTN